VRFRKFGDGLTNVVDCCAYLDWRVRLLDVSRDLAGHVTNAANARRIKAMNAPLQALDGSRNRPSANGGTNLAATMRQLGSGARAAAHALALAPAAQKSRALAAMAKAIRAARPAILAANAQDRDEAKAAGATPAFLDRLALDDGRLAAMAD
jgi:hypothetical protein